jgi:hypothetical protein
MIPADQATALVLKRSEAASLNRERFAVQSCALSVRGDYWIVRINSEDFVLRHIGERQYVGVNAHLVDTSSGQIEIVGSGQSVEQYLEDKYDIATAGGKQYVLEASIDRSDKRSVIRLRQKLEISLQRAMQLVSPESRGWLTGKRRTLSCAQAMLQREGIATTVELREDPGVAVAIDDSVWHWKALVSALSRIPTAAAQ